jgi:hypothetical protein
MNVSPQPSTPPSLDSGLGNSGLEQTVLAGIAYNAPSVADRARGIGTAVFGTACAVVLMNEVASGVLPLLPDFLRPQTSANSSTPANSLSEVPFSANPLTGPLIDLTAPFHGNFARGNFGGVGEAFGSMGRTTTTNKP